MHQEQGLRADHEHAVIARCIGIGTVADRVQFVGRMGEDLLDVDVPLSATVARRQLRLRDILHMQPGDVIPVELPDELIMRANGVPSFKVKLGSHKGNLALQVVEPINRR